MNQQDSQGYHCPSCLKDEGRVAASRNGETPFVIVLLGVVFYVALKTSLHVENDDAGWPTIRRLYRRLTG